MNDAERQPHGFREGVALLSPSWRWVYVDDVSARLRGRSRDELEGRLLHEVLPGVRASALFATLTRCMQQRAGACCEEVVAVDGQRVVLSLRIEPCLDGLIVYSRRLGAAAAPRVCVLEDRRADRRPLTSLLERAGIEPTLIAHEPGALLESLALALPTVAVVDLGHPKRDRMWIVNALVRRFPSLKVLVLAPRARAEVARSLTLLGASTVVSAERPTAAELSQALKALLEVPRANGATRAAPAQLEKLTPREREVLGHIANGSDNLKIAATLGIAERTVKTHVSNIFRKIGAENRVELALAVRS